MPHAPDAFYASGPVGVRGFCNMREEWVVAHQFMLYPTVKVAKALWQIDVVPTNLCNQVHEPFYTTVAKILRETFSVGLHRVRILDRF